jgi:hypothetical protein
MKKWIFVIVGVFLAIVVFVKIANTSVLEITVSGVPANSLITYQITDHSNGKSTTSSSYSNSTRLFVAKASYTVRITSGYASNISSTTTTGFFSSNSITAVIKSENARTYLGDNPSLCMHLLFGQLVSYDCSGDFSQMKLHVPATASLPGYTTLPKGGYLGQMEGLIDTPEGAFALIMPQVFDYSDATAATHRLLHLTQGLNVDRTISLAHLTGATPYQIASYLNGFIVYDANFKTIYYYPSTSSNGQIITLPTPDSKFTPTSLTVSGSTITVAYTNDRESTDPSSKGDRTTVVVYAGAHANTYTFPDQATTVIQCSQDKLCILNNRSLDIFKTGQSKPALLASIGDVDAIEASGSPDSVLAVRPQGVVNINTNDAAGYESYSFGDYKYCGIQPAAKGYLLCIGNSKVNSALYVDQTNPILDPIDKQILKLQGNSDISKITVSGSFIYIVPNGKLEYLPSKQTYGFDTATTAATQSRINQAIDATGINKSHYKVIFTTPIGF